MKIAQKETKIDFNHITRFFGINVLSDGKHWLTDNNKNINAIMGDPEASEKTYKIIEVDMNIPWCEFWAKTEVRGKVLSYFRSKYGNTKFTLEVIE